MTGTRDIQVPDGVQGDARPGGLAAATAHRYLDSGSDTRTQTQDHRQDRLGQQVSQCCVLRLNYSDANNGGVHAIPVGARQGEVVRRSTELQRRSGIVSGVLLVP